MKIDLTSPNTMSGLESRGASKASSADVSSKTEAQRSSEANSLDRASLGVSGASLEASSDIRHERVAALRSAISEGTYQIGPTKIAAAMMSEHFGPGFGR